MSLKSYFRNVSENRADGLGAKVLSPFISLATFLYGKAAGMNRSLREKGVLKSEKLPFPVISVGNLTWGGTGKTPLVEYLSRRMISNRKKPLVLTRGYSHDEVDQLKHHLSDVVLGVGKNRCKEAHKIHKKEKIDVAILDDGLQHMKVKRDVEIITINALNPFGNGHLIPKGILREPLSVLKKAQIIVFTHVNLIKHEEMKKLRSKVQELAPQARFVQTCFEPLFFYRAKNRARISIEKMRGKRVSSFSGIGTPRSFQLVLEKSHVKPVRNFEFMDHYEFKKGDLKEIKEVSRLAAVDDIVTTEKDYYRSKPILTTNLNPLVLATRLKILSGEEVLNKHLMRLLGLR